MQTYAQVKQKLLKDKETRDKYKELGPEFALMTMLIEKRLEKKLTQEDLARKINTKQSAIARLESGTYNPSIAFLKKVAKALDVELKISFR